MNRKLRITLDYIELPYTIAVLMFSSDEMRRNALTWANGLNTGWREHTYPFRIFAWIVKKLTNNK